MTGGSLNMPPEWVSAIGRIQVEQQRLELEPLRRYAVALGGDPDVERNPPPLPHWAFFLPLATDAALGEDGHPRRGPFLPPIPLARRMFAAAGIDFIEPLLLGEIAELSSCVTDVVRKHGGSGELVFVQVERLLRQKGLPRVRERQTYVYRDAGSATTLPVPSGSPQDGELWRPEHVHLFRFSAATFNSHRIHFDQAYAMQAEGYPQLIVQGPFTAAKLAALAERRGRLNHFSFRAQAPLFAGQPIRLLERDDQLTAIRCDGTIAMTARTECK